MSKPQPPPSHQSSSDFDENWYRQTYPDVDATGLSPREHFEWLGRRLNRLGKSPSGLTATIASSTALQSSDRAAGAIATQPNDRFGNTSIKSAVGELCSWVFSGSQATTEDQEEFSSKFLYDFLNSEANGVFQENKNGCALVDLMGGFNQYCRPIENQNIQDSNEEANSILLVSYYAPSRLHAGGLRLLDIYSEIRARNKGVKLILLAARHDLIADDDALLEDIFDEMHFCEAGRFGPIWARDVLDGHPKYDLVDLQFHQAGGIAGTVRPFAKRLIFTPMEALARFDFDIFKSAALAGEVKRDTLFSFIYNGLRERTIMRSVDMTVCVSEADAAFLASLTGSPCVSYFPTGISKREFGPQVAKNFRPSAVKERPNRLVFAAYFGSDTNVRGLEWYLQSVHPLVRQACPDYTLAVVGRGDTSSLTAKADSSVHFIGEVPNLAPVLEQAKAGLVLALFGSGFRGKINQYAICGLPSISTRLGATGLSYVDGEDILIAEGADEFAAACIRILTDDKAADTLAKKARERSIREYSWDGLWAKVSRIYKLRHSD